MKQHTNHHHCPSCEAGHSKKPGADAQTVIDPVCGMSVSTDSTIRHKHQGKTYYFCSEHCKKKFMADPESFLEQKTREISAPQSGTDIWYTCPMHPEVRQLGPGNCPKCGMSLEPEAPALEDEENPELADFRRRFWWTLPLTLVVLVLAMAGHRVELLTAAERSWIELLLSAPVVLWAGWPFFLRWAESDFLLPDALTAGASRIRIEIRPLQPGWNEFRYELWGSEGALK